VLPRRGNESADERGDSAASVYVTWKRGLRWYSLKYVWSSVGPRDAICDRHRNPFLAQDTIILESGEPIGFWKQEEIDLDLEFRRHFESGNPHAEVFFFLAIWTSAARLGPAPARSIKRARCRRRQRRDACDRLAHLFQPSAKFTSSAARLGGQRDIHDHDAIFAARGPQPGRRLAHEAERGRIPLG
jgi:hypothetical protein